MIARRRKTVLHRARLLLWAAVEESGNGVHLTAAQLGIRIARLDLSHKPDGGEVMQVPHEWIIVGFGLKPGQVPKPSNGRLRNQRRGPIGPSNVCGNVAK